MSGFWRQWARKELVPWQASACTRPPRTLQASVSPPATPTIYARVYDAYNSSGPPARIRSQSSGSWSPTGPPTRAAPRLRNSEELLQPALGEPRLQPVVNEGVLDPNGVPKAKTYGLALAHSIPKMRTTLDLGTGYWDQRSPSPMFPADEVLLSTLGSTTKGGRDPYKLADWPLPRAITLVPSYSAPELPGARHPPPQPPPPPRSRHELEAAVRLAEARAAARPVTLTLQIGVDGAVGAASHVVGPVPGAAKVALSASERAALKRCHQLGAAYEAGLSLPETVGLTVQILRRRHDQPVGPLPKLDQSMMRLRTEKIGDEHPMVSQLHATAREAVGKAGIRLRHEPTGATSSLPSLAERGRPRPRRSPSPVAPRRSQPWCDSTDVARPKRELAM